MAVSYSQCVQSLKVSSIGGRSRDNHWKRNCLVFASAKESDHLVLQSKVTFVVYIIMHFHFLLLDQLLLFYPLNFIMLVIVLCL